MSTAVDLFPNTGERDFIPFTEERMSMQPGYSLLPQTGDAPPRIYIRGAQHRHSVPNVVVLVSVQSEARSAPADEAVLDAMAAYAGRLEELRGFAEDESELVNEESVSRFFAFLRRYKVVSKASLVLSNENDLCARWRSEDGSSEINAKFFSDDRVRWVSTVEGDPQGANAAASHGDFYRSVQLAGLGMLFQE